MKPLIYDRPKEGGIDLVFDLENGMGITIFLEDIAAKDIVNIIQNKLNARC